MQELDVREVLIGEVEGVDLTEALRCIEDDLIRGEEAGLVLDLRMLCSASEVDGLYSGRRLGEVREVDTVPDDAHPFAESEVHRLIVACRLARGEDAVGAYGHVGDTAQVDTLRALPLERVALDGDDALCGECDVRKSVGIDRAVPTDEVRIAQS